MFENIPDADINYSLGREEPRETFAFPQNFDLETYDHDDVFVKDLLIVKQPYELNERSPTPLDPFHLKLDETDYFTSAGFHVERRLMKTADAIGLSEEARERITSEIEYEHLHRSLKNNDAMKRLRVAFENEEQVDSRMAELILRARAGNADIQSTAYLLAAFPEMEAIEVMKYTEPLQDKKLELAHAHFIYALRMAAREVPGMVVETVNGNTGIRPRRSHDSVLSNIFIAKGKEADIFVENIHLELISRYSYYVPDTTERALMNVMPTMCTMNGRSIAMYRIALSKYLRVAKSSSDSTDHL